MEELKEIPMLRQLTPPDLCRTELAAAFGKLEKSMNAAAERIALNARLIAIITDTTEVEHAAETVSVATEGEAQAKLEVARDTRQNDASDEAENGVAAHVLKLHGRLGGFMKC
jgi:DNA polymerase II large subunit